VRHGHFFEEGNDEPRKRGDEKPEEQEIEIRRRFYSETVSVERVLNSLLEAIG
jgi:hypothetical protein